jgi:hypothetical protein
MPKKDQRHYSEDTVQLARQGIEREENAIGTDKRVAETNETERVDYDAVKRAWESIS